MEKAIAATGACADAAAACGSHAARTYVAGACGALRHARAILSSDARVASIERSGDFERRRIGRVELVGTPAGWDTAIGCRMPNGSLGHARALWPRRDPVRGVWMRSLDPDALTAVRGRLERDGEDIRFIDKPDADLPPSPPVRHDLGRDLVRAGLPDVAGTPALGTALELALASGSWLHLSAGTRWFTDAAGARTILRMLGSSLAVDPGQRHRLAGMVDREALMLVERLGWRHVPTPRV